MNAKTMNTFPLLKTQKHKLHINDESCVKMSYKTAFSKGRNTAIMIRDNKF